MTKARKRNKNLNDALLSRSCGKHKPKVGKHVSRARRKHNQNKGDIDD